MSDYCKKLQILLLFHIHFTTIRQLLHQMHNNIHIQTYPPCSWHILKSRGHIAMTTNAKFNTLFT